MIIHDLRCACCGNVRKRVTVEFGKYGRCGCGGSLAVTWEGGKPPANDLVKESQRFNRGLGIHVTTSREIDREARIRGWEPIADKIHGAPYVPEYHPPKRRKPNHARRRASGSGNAKFEEVAH
jgi:hypothetical protein